jgi:hypothetical protein
LKLLYPLLTLLLLPLIAIAWVIQKIVVFFKRSSKNGMIYLDVEGEKVLFSPYFELETLFQDTKLLVKLVITLSNEGLQKKMQAPLTNEAEKVNQRQHIFREATLFFINQGETPVEITPMFLEIDAQNIYKLDNEAQLIAAGHYHECEPSMAVDVQDKRSFHIKVVVSYKDEMYELEGVANRMSVKDMDEKYQQEKVHREAE